MHRLLTDDQLVTELNRLGVNFLSGEHVVCLDPPVTPLELLVGLAKSTNARVRLSIIPLLLLHSSYSYHAVSAVENLSDNAQNTLMLFYTAALLLQCKYQNEFLRLCAHFESLPDLFSYNFCLDRAEDTEQQLRQLSERHQRLSGWTVNWKGTYEHAAERMIKRLKSESIWQNQAV